MDTVQPYPNLLPNPESVALLQRLIEERSSSPNSTIALEYCSTVVQNVQRSIEEGRMLVPDKPTRSVSSRDYVQNPKNVGFAPRNLKLINRAGSRNGTLASANKVLTAEEHMQIVNRMRKNHSVLDEKRTKHVAEMQQRMEEEQLRVQVLERQQLERGRMQKRTAIEGHSKERAAHQEQRKLELMEANRRLEKVKQQKHLYQIAEERYKTEILMPGLEERKEKLKELRQLKKPINTEELNQFQKQYLKNKQAFELNLQHKKVAQPKYRPPPKSSRLEHLLQQEKRSLHIKSEERRRSLQNKLERTEVYVQYLKQNFQPKVRKAKETQPAEVQSREPVSCKQIGNAYLQYSKNHRTRGNLKSQTIQNMSQGTDITSKINYLHSRDSEHYQNLRQKRLNRIIQSESMSRGDKIEQLNKQSQRLGDLATRKDKLAKIRNLEEDSTEMSDILLANIKTKMGLLEIFNT